MPALATSSSELSDGGSLIHLSRSRLEHKTNYTVTTCQEITRINIRIENVAYITTSQSFVQNYIKRGTQAVATRFTVVTNASSMQAHTFTVVKLRRPRLILGWVITGKTGHCEPPSK